MNPLEGILNYISNNPKLANNPMAQSGLDAIKNGDSKAGEQLANNWLATMGMSKEDAMKQAKLYFRI